MKKLEVVLPQEAINRLAAGKAVTVRYQDFEWELRFDPLARVGQGSFQDLIAEVQRTKCG